MALPHIDVPNQNPIAVVASLTTRADLAAHQAEESARACEEYTDTCKKILSSIPDEVKKAVGPLQASVNELLESDKLRKQEEERRQKQLSVLKAGAISTGGAVGGAVLSNLPAVIELIKGLFQ